MSNADAQQAFRQGTPDRGRRARRLLMDAACALIAEVGWNSVTTRNLAERAGIRSGLVHYHFDSLADLLRKAAIDEITRLVDAQLSSDGNLVDGDNTNILQIVTEDLNSVNTSTVLMVETYLAAVRDPDLAERLNEQLDRYRTAIATVLERAGNPAPHATTLVVLAALDGLVLQKRLDPSLRIDDALALLHTLTYQKEE